MYNDFQQSAKAPDVTIIAGCGIHNCGGGNAQHDGIHTFWLAKNAKLRYVEKHYGEGDGRGKQIMNPTTIVHLAEGAQMEMETTPDRRRGRHHPQDGRRPGRGRQPGGP